MKQPSLKTIPIPVRGKWRRIVRGMSVGGSHWLKDLIPCHSFCRAIRDEGFKPIFRREDKGWRIWKTK